MLGNSHALRQVLVDGQAVLLDLILARLRRLVQAVAWVFDSEHVHFHASSEVVQQIEGETNVLCITMEVNDKLIAALLVR